MHNTNEIRVCFIRRARFCTNPTAPWLCNTLDVMQIPHLARMHCRLFLRCNSILPAVRESGKVQ